MFDDFEDSEFIDDAKVYSLPSASSLKPPRESTEIFGNEAHEEMLLSLFNQKKLPHSLIFAGPMGIGKATMAFRVARFLLKHGNTNDSQESLFGEASATPTTMDVSAEDAVFSRVASGGHPDLRYIERVLNDKGIKKGNIDVDSIRKIAPFLRMSASDGGWRVVIVDEADTMNRQAQNAILKILEEPPSKTLLILICNRLGAMIPTIRSRCRTFMFQPLDETALTTLLKRIATNATKSELDLLVALSDGSMGRAITLHEEKGVNTLNSIIAFLEDFPEWKWSKIHPYADSLSRDEKAYLSFISIMEWVAAHFLKTKAVNTSQIPEILRTPNLQKLQNYYSLEQWIGICEKLKEHFTSIDVSNLDKRQGVIGAFAIIGGQS